MLEGSSGGLRAARGALGGPWEDPRSKRSIMYCNLPGFRRVLGRAYGGNDPDRTHSVAI